jgi:hypothetical protein
MDNLDTDFLSFLCAGDEKRIEAIRSGERSFIFEERLAKANSLVDEGNAKFKANEFSGANQMYLSAACQVDFDLGQQFDMTEEHKKQIRSSKIRILLNLCNNSLKLKEFRHVRKSATLGLKLCAKESSPPEIRAKFLYRRGRANLEDNNPTDAVEDLKEAVKLVPNDSAVRELYTIASQGSKKQHQDSDNVWKGKFQEEESLPEVDLIITDNSGNPIYKTKKEEKPRKAVQAPEAITLVDILCCRRRKAAVLKQE